MTAQMVDGRAVTEVRPARSPLTDPAGNPVFFRQMVELGLNDGATVFGCVHCDFTAPRVAGVRTHLAIHTGRRTGRPKREGAAAGFVAVSMRDWQDLTAQCEHWKQRAKKAEKSLRAMRRALGVSGDQS